MAPAKKAEPAKKAGPTKKASPAKKVALAKKSPPAKKIAVARRPQTPKRPVKGVNKKLQLSESEETDEDLEPNFSNVTLRRNQLESEVFDKDDDGEEDVTASNLEPAREAESSEDAELDDEEIGEPQGNSTQSIQSKRRPRRTKSSRAGIVFPVLRVLVRSYLTQFVILF